MRRIGILDLQGGVVEHLEHLARLGVPAARVKQAGDMTDLADLAGLVLPGGESSCLGRLLRAHGLDREIRKRFAAGLKLWGTCAGAILLARQVDGEGAHSGLHLGLMDMDIQRNAFGSQLASFNTRAEIPAVSGQPIPLTFIRAPKITRLGEGVRSLLMLDGDAGNTGSRYCAAAEDAQTLVTTFHPELTPDLAFHRYFCHKCGVETRPAPAPSWQRDSWTRLVSLP